MLIDKMYTFDMLQKDFGLKVSRDKPWFEALKNIPITKSIYIEQYYVAVKILEDNRE